MRAALAIVLGLTACLEPVSVPLPQGLPAELQVAGIFSTTSASTRVEALDLAAPVHRISSVSGATQELWLWSCGPADLGLPVATGPVPRPAEAARQGECVEQGAPCPAQAFRLDLEAVDPWQPISASAQPWPGKRPQSCPSLADARLHPIPGLSDAAVPTFVEAIEPDLIIVGSRIDPGGAAPTGQLDLWRLGGDGPDADLSWLDGVVTSTAWLAALRLADGRLFMLGAQGITATLAVESDQIVLRPGEPFPRSESACEAGDGTVLPAKRGAVAGGTTTRGQELWIGNLCGAIGKRVADGPWQVVRSKLVRRLDSGDVGLLWLGPGEVLAAGFTPEGVLHVDDDAQNIESVSQSLPTRSLGLSPGGLPLTPLFDGEISGAFFERGALGGWRQWGEGYSRNVTAFASVGDSVVAGGTHHSRLLQVREDAGCPAELSAEIAEGPLFHAITYFRGHVVAILTPTLHPPVVALLSAMPGVRCDAPPN